MAKLFNISGKIWIGAFISPFEESRAFWRKIHQDNGKKYLEWYLSTPIEVCEERDVKGLYK